MFEYAIKRNEKERLTGRTISSYIASCVLHALMLLALFEYPELLRGGMYHRFRAFSTIADSLMFRPKNDDKDWRTVTVLKPQSNMMAPSAATLKKYLFDWNKKHTGNGVPPIRIRFGDEQKAAMRDLPPMPRVRQEPKAPQISLPANELASASPTTQPPTGQSGDGAAGSSPGGRNESASGKRDTIGLPTPTPAPKSDTASNSAPSAIPSGVKTPPSAAPAPAGTLKVFESEQKAIHSPDSGIFDTKGFPLGEYVNIIKERIKGNWFIPSNLQSFQGHTTIIFYIDRDGRYTNAHIVTRSGSNSFDNAALMAVIESDPFPPLPKTFPGNHIGAKFVLSWNEP